MLVLLGALKVVMEYMEGGTLSQAIRHFEFEESQIAYVAREVLSCPPSLSIPFPSAPIPFILS